MSVWAKDKKPSELPSVLPAGQTPVLEADVVASAVGYHRNVKDVDYKIYPQRKLPEAKNQFCRFCANYTPLNEGWGKCAILTDGVVSSQGWCSSWMKKTT